MRLIRLTVTSLPVGSPPFWVVLFLRLGRSPSVYVPEEEGEPRWLYDPEELPSVAPEALNSATASADSEPAAPPAVPLVQSPSVDSVEKKTPVVPPPSVDPVTKEPAVAAATAPPAVPLVQSPPVNSMKEKKTPATLTVPVVEKSPPVDSTVPSAFAPLN
ncbi:hypothetical protein ACRALDRAFT_204797 [Sodiomyces alcalophilus JCM 7366]|uniref:uncharacterized protein n=1 Tax=Sodiomyces alcalophilus JCM 7366 TaxID=591952 RepID=UPI0039B3C39D